MFVKSRSKEGGRAERKRKKKKREGRRGEKEGKKGRKEGKKKETFLPSFPALRYLLGFPLM